MFSIGIFAQALLLLLAKAFYASQDTKTPALVSIGGMAVNIFFCLLLVRFLSFPNFFQHFFLNFLALRNLKNIEVIGLPLAISLSAIFQFLLLFFLFRHRVKNTGLRSPITPGVKNSLKKELAGSDPDNSITLGVKNDLKEDQKPC
jgi:peptidoglycan biosynthesis protein MviN/MurJ (putative lipid II flippase)